MGVPGFGLVAEDIRRWTVHVLSPDETASGSGIVTGPGSVITNAHVARTDQVRIQLWSGEVLQGAVEKRDSGRDLALLRVQGLNTGASASLRDSSTVRAGEIAIAIGNPLGFTGALSTGVIRGVGRMPGLGPREWIQAAVRLAPGNSGGPLTDSRGRVIGINTMVFNGLGLAIPSQAVQTFLSTKAPFRLGVVVREAVLRDGTQGALVLELEDGGAASQAALLPGDLIVGLDHRSVTSSFDLSEALSETRDTVTIRFRRGGQAQVRQAVARAQLRREQAA